MTDNLTVEVAQSNPLAKMTSGSSVAAAGRFDNDHHPKLDSGEPTVEAALAGRDKGKKFGRAASILSSAGEKSSVTSNENGGQE